MIVLGTVFVTDGDIDGLEASQVLLFRFESFVMAAAVLVGSSLILIDEAGE